MECIFKLLLALSSTSLLGTVYFIKQNYVFTVIIDKPQYVSYGLVFAIPLIFTLLSLFVSFLLSPEELDEVNSIEEISNNFLPSYLGYFFVGLSINTDETFWYIFILVVIFTYLSQSNYFNPIFLLLGYSFYSAVTPNNKKIILISKDILATPDDVISFSVKRINTFTFIASKQKG